MSQRSVSVDAVYQAVANPDKQFPEKGSKAIKFIRTVGARTYHVVALWKAPEKSWLIISVWVRGEDDKESLIAQIILLPFKLIWWILKQLWRVVFTKK